MKTKILWILLMILFPEVLLGQIERSRTWENADGKKILAKILRLEDGEVILERGGKEFHVPMKGLSKGDQAYVFGFKERQPFGKIGEMALEASSEQKTWLREHTMRSLVWEGEVYGERLRVPFLLYVPDGAEKGEKFPLIVHLHGTGGIGADNLTPLFKDGGAVAQSFMNKKLQKSQPTLIMIPQTSIQSGWSAGSWTSPSQTMVGLVDTIRLLQKDAKIGADPRRVYLTGISMGGRGVFQGMAKFPKFFAAGIPISHVENTGYFTKERDNAGPMWVVVNEGDKDYAERLKTFRRSYISAGGDIRISIFKGKGHNAWDQLLGDAGFRQRLYRQKLD